MRIPIVIITVVSVLAGCTALFGADRNADERFVRREQPQTSPSGEFVAHAETRTRTERCADLDRRDHRTQRPTEPTRRLAQGEEQQYHHNNHWAARQHQHSGSEHQRP